MPSAVHIPLSMVNRLAASSSPYLLQHAHNPVPWWPWCDKAIAEARDRDVPIFLSVGYSTCYWCHVMERESFEDPAIGALLGREFVAIKLDREERPEIDEIYMAAVQMLTGRGGWPMSVFLEPRSLRPFWGGTYFPPRPAHGLPSFRQVLEGLADSWKQRRSEVMKQAETITAAVREHLHASSSAAVPIGRPQVAMCVQTLLTIFDRTHGGFGGAPKFPQPVYLDFLLDARERIEGSSDESEQTSEPAARQAVDVVLRRTLDAMALGGMHDHVGGGFHRYSVDAAWIVPHFEKMLYDQGQLLGVYARAAAVFQDELYARVARRIAQYVAMEMTLPGGGFASAQDAEVDGREGLNYLWTPADLAAALPPGQAGHAAELFGVSRGANFRDPHHPQEPPRSVLTLEEHPQQAARRSGRPLASVLAELDALCEPMLAFRDRRKQPRLDDKILASWNGIMISGLAVAGQVLADGEMLALARASAEFVLSKMRKPDGTLVRSLRLRRGDESRSADAHADAPQIAGVLEDYAWLAQGLFDLSLAEPEAAAAQRWLNTAQELANTGLRLFGTEDGTLFDGPESPDLFVRPRSTYDGAVPSAGSVLLRTLARLATRGDNPEFALATAQGLAAVSAAVAQSPISAINSVRALLEFLGSNEPELVNAIAARREAAGGATFEGTIASDRARATEGEIVSIEASEQEVFVGLDHPAELRLRLHIAEGHHLVAANPGDSVEANALVPTRLSVVGGSGLAAYAEMPAGELLDPHSSGSPRIYRGTLEFPVAVEMSGPWAGRPRLAITYQACSERACDRPRTVELDILVSRLAGGGNP